MSFLIDSIEAALNPVGLVWLVLLFLALQSWRRQERLRAAITAAAALLIWIGGATPLHAYLVAHLEEPYLAATVENAPSADVVVVLGGMLASPTPEPYGFTIVSGAGRIVSGVEAIRRGKGKVLVFGGGVQKAGTDNVPEGVLLEKLVAGWGVVDPQVISMPASRTTREEAMRFRALMATNNWRSVILVTSAYHMERSLAAFRREGVRATPVAADYIGLPALRAGSVRFRLVPTGAPLKDISIFIHEVLGRVYYRLRGWTADPDTPTDSRQ